MFRTFVPDNVCPTCALSALQAGRLLRSKGFEFDFAFCSVLKRCVKSLHTVLEEADQLWVPEQKSWRLNERHYGELQDLNKAKVAAQVGDDTATAWRRSYATQPPGKVCCKFNTCSLLVDTHFWTQHMHKICTFAAPERTSPSPMHQIWPRHMLLTCSQNVPSGLPICQHRATASSGGSSRCPLD